MMGNFTKRSRIVRAMNSVAAGTTTQTATSVDTEGADSVTAILALGAITATGVPALVLYGGDASDGSDKVAISGATKAYTDADGNKLAVVEIVKMKYKYITVVVTRGTANAVIDGCILIFSYNRTSPQASETTVVGTVCVAPDAF